jgi:hypothetical protein
MKSEIRDPITPKTCSIVKAKEISLYLFEMSRLPFGEMREPDKKFALRMYEHLRECELCAAACLELKVVYSSNESYSSTFTPENFIQIRENEGVLETLC